MAQRISARDRMLNSAVELFRQHGVAGTALSDVIAHSEAPRGSIYHHFPDGKAQLAAEATEHAGRLMSELITRWVGRYGPAGAIERIVEMFRRQLRDSGYASGCPVAAGALEGGSAPDASGAAGAAFAAWEDALAEAFTAHGVAAERAAGIASLVVCAIEGAIIVARAQRTTRPLDRCVAELTAML